MPKLPQTARKMARKEVENNLIQLETLKQLLGKKKFEKRIKQAAKLLTNDLPKTVKTKNSNNAEPAIAVATSTANAGETAG